MEGKRLWDLVVAQERLDEHLAREAKHIDNDGLSLPGRRCLCDSVSSSAVPCYMGGTATAADVSASEAPGGILPSGDDGRVNKFLPA